MKSAVKEVPLVPEAIERASASRLRVVRREDGTCRLNIEFPEEERMLVISISEALFEAFEAESTRNHLRMGLGG